jgi:hypothetical protein
MQRHSIHDSLGRPALHILLALAFAVAFFWPIFAMTRASQTFHFLYASWLLSLVVLFVISRGREQTSEDAAEINHEARAENAEEMY